MCGIIGYVGDKGVIPILLEGLRSLEYRGYDSTGIAIYENNDLNVIKSIGKLSKLEEILKNGKNCNSTNGHVSCGIGHTRWATHGEPSDINAHPHFDHDEKIAVVHNGIIRNYQEVRKGLVNLGIKFLSETDTEVTVQLIASYLKSSKSILDAICKAVNELEGSYALAIIFKDEPNKIYAVRKESPLVIGIGKKENYLASDLPTVSRFVDKVIRLGDNEIAEITSHKVEFFNFCGGKVKKTIQIVTKTQDFLDKRGFKHYLAKEINEQADVVSNLLSNFLQANKIQFNHLSLDKEYLKTVDRILILACGTAYHAGLVGKHVIETLTGLPTEVQFASEYLNSAVLLTPKSLVIAISQSGETADTLSAIKKAISSGANLIGITNREGSALTDLSKENLIISNAGVEVSVAATKTFIAQITVLYLLAIYISEFRVLDSHLQNIKQDLRAIPRLIDQTLTRAEYYQEQVTKYGDKRDFVFIGRGINYPIALEAALKLKELSYIHASGYASGEMKHGPIAVLDPNVPVVSIIVPGETYDRVLQNSVEAKSRSAPMIAVACDGDKKVDSVFNTVLHIPLVSEILSPFLTVIPMQFLAYYIAEYLGRDIDQPRNLAKSVTVE
ncbi:MAG: glutamine--fructose-6-phosphate transaminase (isomerizing) [Candidatus Melainabacteria bacterium]|nr:glutamine--fructose-6-phosphate transaminase (isomerizing) [Candidatus Melainabacteria bacterium]